MRNRVKSASGGKKILLLSLIVLVVAFYSGLSNLGVAIAQKDDIVLKTFVHDPQGHGKPLPPSNCTVTTNDQVSDFGLAGWQMPSSGMSYKINLSTKPKNLTDSEVKNAIADSFGTWNAADPNQIFTDGGTTTAKTAKYDGTNAILWKSIMNSALAITYAWYNSSNGQLVEADTVFNQNYKWDLTNISAGDCGGTTGDYDVQNIATHEFGHWVGLDDLYSSADKDLTMYGYGETKELKKDSLGLGDKTGVIAIAP
ncbi:MAG: matrixin family metalloprotease [Candidatus Berkelbacteria bacterium]|nr:matrixin family metalloprotease [Candidatus Berkelbacteria bacterium]